MSQHIREISSSTKLMGIIGQQIGYSLSPRIHNFSASSLNIDIVYLNCDMPAESLENFLIAAWNIGALGFNVTTPFKSTITSLLSEKSLESANTLYRGKAGWSLASTDAEGFDMAIKRLGFNFSGFKRVVFLGCGGVVSAILSYITKRFENSPEIAIVRRSPTQDERVRSFLPNDFPLKFFDFKPSQFEKIIRHAGGETLVVQATSAPHRGDDLAAFVPALQDFKGVFVDLVYGRASALLEAAQNKGIPCQDGLPMLIEQARLSQRLWWGEALDYQRVFDFLSQSNAP